ncbi:hypothetical protein [Streptomyces synnematoformans]|uniref:Uncharacterized protein n=1 Tax=Streptomyces synnematoformans TaxID=415721 RepID=A0ABN2Y3H3_9ACTN
MKLALKVGTKIVLGTPLGAAATWLDFQMNPATEEEKILFDPDIWKLLGDWDFWTGP